MTSNLFPGPAVPLPGRTDDGVFRLLGELPPPVRHAAGYTAFADFVTAQGDAPARLATDLAALLAFLSTRRQLLQDERLLDSAAIFFGNALAAVHARAVWRVHDELEVGTRSHSFPVVSAVRVLAQHPERHAGFLELLQGWRQDDEDQDELHRLSRSGHDDEAALDLPAEEFLRPAFPEQVFLDDEGNPIPYGDPDRWPDGAPHEAYSRVTHEERFAPLQAEVDALVAHLARTCEVDVARQDDDAGSRVFTLTPARGAPIRLVSTPTSVVLTAGALFTGWYPSCSCDACNESAADAADSLEDTVLGIVGGGLRERDPVGRRDWQQTSLRTPGGRSSGAGPLDPGLDDDRDRARLRLRLAALADGSWPAWPHRVVEDPAET